tara:strand:+ start:25322 stop:26791 length:1470 start_codon:yes stop_codon:yes gene_type:complete
MKTSAIKIVQSYLNKKNINNIKKFINRRNLIIGSFLAIIILLLSYLLRPVFFDYESNKEVFKKKIDNHLKVQSKIKGEISYYFFPQPRITVNDLEIYLKDSTKKPIILKKTDFFISPSKLDSLDKIKIKKVHIKNQKIEIFSSQFRSYLEYFQKNKISNLKIKGCEIFFQDEQNNSISINDFNFKNNLNENEQKFFINGIFAKNKFKINFTDKENEEKYLDFSIPKLDTFLKIIFDKDSNLKKTSGKLNLKILNNILLLNFEGNGNYKISESFFRNKFLNSKLNGNINFKNNFYFDLNLDINRVNLRKLFLYFASFNKTSSSSRINISKKINGEVKVRIKRTESFIGRVEETSFILQFENGNVKITSGSANLGKNGKFKFNISLLGSGKDQRVNFFINFLSTKGKRIFKKFNINSNEQDLSFNSIGSINLMQKKVRLDKLVVNEESLKGKNLNIVEDSFNKYVIQDEVFGFLDFFKIKKFIAEVYNNLE